MTIESMAQAVEKLNGLEAKLYAFRHAMGNLQQDGETVAPVESAEGRGRTLGVLSGLEYGIIADPETLELAT